MFVGSLVVREACGARTWPISVKDRTTSHLFPWLHPSPPPLLPASGKPTTRKAFHGGGVGHGGDSVIVGMAHVHGDPYAVSATALKVVSAGFTEVPERKRAVLPPHLALAADVAVTKPLRASAVKAVFGCCKRRKDAGKTCFVSRRHESPIHEFFVEMSEATARCGMQETGAGPPGPWRRHFGLFVPQNQGSKHKHPQRWPGVSL